MCTRYGYYNLPYIDGVSCLWDDGYEAAAFIPGGLSIALITGGLMTKKVTIGMNFYRKQYAKETWEMYKGGFDSDFVAFFETFRDEVK